MKTVLNLPIEAAPFNWFTFGNSLLHLFPRIGVDEVSDAAWGPGETSDETEQNYREAEAPFVAEMENVIRTLCEAGSAPMPSKAATYFLFWRATTVAGFLLKLLTSTDPNRYSSIIPFPSLPTPAVIQWFLIEWWTVWGPDEISDQWHDIAI